MAALANLVRVLSSTTGTGTLTLGSAVSGFLTPTQAGMQDGNVYTYAIEADYVTVGDDLVPTSREVGLGTYASGAGTLTRVVENSTNSNALLNLTGDEQVTISVIAESVREKLTANRTYYVRSDGSDSNSGLANTAGGAFLTAAAAWTAICSLVDFAGFTVTLQLQNTTWTTGIALTKPWFGGGALIIDVATGTINTASSHCIAVSCPLPGEVTVQNMTLTCAGGNNCINHAGSGLLSLASGVTFGAAGLAHINCTGAGANVNNFATYTITGGGYAHMLSQGSGAQINGGFTTVTLTGTITFTGAFAVFSRASSIVNQSATYNVAGATLTCPRIAGDTNAVCYTGGGGSYFPGSSAGGVGSGAQYV